MNLQCRASAGVVSWAWVVMVQVEWTDVVEHSSLVLWGVVGYVLHMPAERYV